MKRLQYTSGSISPGYVINDHKLLPFTVAGTDPRGTIAVGPEMYLNHSCSIKAVYIRSSIAFITLKNEFDDTGSTTTGGGLSMKQTRLQINTTTNAIRKSIHTLAKK